MGKPILRARAKRLHGEIQKLQAELDVCLRGLSNECPVQAGAIVYFSDAGGTGAQFEVVSVRPSMRADGEVGFDLACENPWDSDVTLALERVQQVRAAPADGQLPTWSRTDLPKPSAPGSR